MASEISYRDETSLPSLNDLSRSTTRLLPRDFPLFCRYQKRHRHRRKNRDKVRAANTRLKKDRKNNQKALPDRLEIVCPDLFFLRIFLPPGII
jgi:nucleosome binding factor SPN SPT16 subunit